LLNFATKVFCQWFSLPSLSRYMNFRQTRCQTMPVTSYTLSSLPSGQHCLLLSGRDNKPSLQIGGGWRPMIIHRCRCKSIDTSKVEKCPLLETPMCRCWNLRGKHHSWAGFSPQPAQRSLPWSSCWRHMQICVFMDTLWQTSNPWLPG